MAQSVVVFLRKILNVARSLAGGLRPHFSVHVTRSREELRDHVSRNSPEAVVLNIEMWRLPTSRVCTGTSRTCLSCARTASRMKKCGWPRSRPAPAMSAPPTMWEMC